MADDELTHVASCLEDAVLDCARYAEGDDLQFLKEQLSANEKALNFKDDLGRTPCHMASANGNVEVLKILVAAGALPLGNIEGNTALHYAAVNNHLSCAQVLLESGRWTVGTKNVFGRTALQEISEKQFDDLETLLLQYDEELDRYQCPPQASLAIPGSDDQQPEDCKDGAKEHNGGELPVPTRKSGDAGCADLPAPTQSNITGSSSVTDIE